MGLFPPSASSLDPSHVAPQQGYQNGHDLSQLLLGGPTPFSTRMPGQPGFGQPGFDPGDPYCRSSPLFPTEQYFGGYQQMTSSAALQQVTPDDPYLPPLPSDFHIGRMPSDDLTDIFHGTDLQATNTDLVLLVVQRLAQFGITSPASFRFCRLEDAISCLSLHRDDPRHP